MAHAPIDEEKDKRPAHSIEPGRDRNDTSPATHEVDAPSKRRTDDETDGKTTTRQE